MPLLAAVPVSAGVDCLHESYLSHVLRLAFTGFIGAVMIVHRYGACCGCPDQAESQLTDILSSIDIAAVLIRLSHLCHSKHK